MQRTDGLNILAICWNTHASGIGLQAACWRRFERDGEQVRFTPNGPLVASVIELEVGAATAGLGVIYTFGEFLRPAIQSGALVPMLHEWWESFSGPFL